LADTVEAIEHPKRYASTSPDRLAVVIGGTGQTRTYAELEDRSNRVAHLLRDRGLKPGDNVAILVENRAEYFDVVWGAMRAGLLVTPINWHLAPEEAAYIVADCGASALFASAACHDVLAALPATDEMARFVVEGGAPGFEDFEAALDAQPSTPIADESEGNWMFYSSGTTGKPKGIRPPEIGGALGSPNAFTALVGGLFGGSERTCYLSPAPLYHAAPLGWATAVQRLGGTVVQMERFDPESFLALIEEHRVSLVQVVPTHLVRLLKVPADRRSQHDLSSLEVVVHAAAPCPVDVKRAVIDWLGPIVHEYYSGSEGVGFCAIGPQEWLDHPGSVGRSLLGKVHIVNDVGVEVEAGVEGQVWFEAPRRFDYHGDPEKTSAAFNERGWSTFGDVGRVDDEGYLYLTDRVSNMIISGGVNIYPREIEDVLIAHPAVVDVAVIGVTDPEMGEAVRAVVQPDEMPVDPSALEAELIEYVRQRIARFKSPRSVVFLDELPRMLTGKVARRMLPDEVWS
jgi:acyl-CoA synthetase (AMP-forming)/AMP-acid ligase II